MLLLRCDGLANPLYVTPMRVRLSVLNRQVVAADDALFLLDAHHVASSEHQQPPPGLTPGSGVLPQGHVPPGPHPDMYFRPSSIAARPLGVGQ